MDERKPTDGNHVMANLEARLRNYLRESPKVMTVLKAARDAQLPDWRLFSGAIYQTVWNALTHRPVDYGVKDYDLAYFDLNLSTETEKETQKRLLAKIPSQLQDQVDIANQARVHLWFEKEFGRPYSALINTDEALERSLFTAHAVGVRLEADDSLSIAAPYGLDDTFDMKLIPNPDLAVFNAHAVKRNEAIERWPEITVANC